MAGKLRAAAAMSGGVDSSVVAYLLKEQGYDVTGVTLRLISENDKAVSGMCAGPEGIRDAKSVCDRLGMGHIIIDFTREFKENVMDRFANAYLDGFTPNPCVDCNRYIKFSRMLEYIDEMDMDIFATGHYARIEHNESTGRYILKKAANIEKDQSYFLYALSQSQLAKVRFPLGGMTKDEVRAIAESQGLINARKKDSQDICFVPDGDFAGFIQRHSDVKVIKGSFIDSDGNVLGIHNGAYKFTVGQRKGLGIALGKPAYVLGTDTLANTVTLGDNDMLFTSRLYAHDINLISVEKIDKPMRVEAKIRSAHRPSPAVVEQTDAGELVVEFDEPQRAITPGQSVVLYEGDTVVGGGIVSK